MLLVGEGDLHGDGELVACRNFVRGDGGRSDVVAGNLSGEFHVSVDVHLLQAGHAAELVAHGLGEVVAQRRVHPHGLVLEVVDGNGVDVRLDGGSGKRKGVDAAGAQ